MPDIDIGRWGWSADPHDYAPEFVAIAGDWHGNDWWAWSVLDRLADQNIGVIVQVGDLGFWHGAGGRDYLRRLSHTLADRGQVLFWVDGNHENHTLLNRLPINNSGTRVVADRIVHLPRGHRWTWPGDAGQPQTWLAAGGAASIDYRHRTPYESWWPEETLTDTDIAAATAGGRADVLVCHDAPTGITYLDQWLATHGFHLPEAEQAYTRDHRRKVRTIVDTVTPAHVWHGHYHIRYDDTLTDNPRVQVHGLAADGDDGNLAIYRLTSFQDMS